MLDGKTRCNAGGFVSVLGRVANETQIPPLAAFEYIRAGTKERFQCVYQYWPLALSSIAVERLNTSIVRNKRHEIERVPVQYGAHIFNGTIEAE